MIASFPDTPVAPHLPTNGSSYKDRDVQPPVHMVSVLADGLAVSHLFHVQPLEAFSSAPLLAPASALFVLSFTAQEPLPALSFKLYPLASALLPPCPPPPTPFNSPKLCCWKPDRLDLLKRSIPAPPLLTSECSTVEQFCGLDFLSRSSDI